MRSLSEQQRDQVKINAEALYNLTPQEFEKLVAALLSASGFSEFGVVAGPKDKGVDIIGKIDNDTIAIQASHKVNFRRREVEQFLERYFADPTTPRSLIYVTSAKVSPTDAQIGQHLAPGQHFRLLGRDDVLRLIKEYPNVANQFLRVAKERRASLNYQLLGGVIAAIASMAAVIFSNFSFFVPKAPLDQRIQTVESALASIRDLEIYLQKVKQDMLATEKATQLLDERYAQAKELDKLTQEQLNALKATLQTESWHGRVFNYAIGFVLGVASSLVATVLYAKWRQRKTLE